MRQWSGLHAPFHGAFVSRWKSKTRLPWQSASSPKAAKPQNKTGLITTTNVFQSDNRPPLPQTDSSLQTCSNSTTDRRSVAHVFNIHKISLSRANRITPPPHSGTARTPFRGAMTALLQAPRPALCESEGEEWQNRIANRE